MKTVGRGPNLPSQVAQMISDEIVGGRIKAGERLPTERELAESFGVSRNVVREAIAKLRFEGVVETRQGVGVFVLGEESRSVLRIDAEILRDNSLMRSLFELRSIIEVEAAGLAAVRRSRSDLAAIKSAMLALDSSEASRVRRTPTSNSTGRSYRRPRIRMSRPSSISFGSTFAPASPRRTCTSIMRRACPSTGKSTPPSTTRSRIGMSIALASACERTSPTRWDGWDSPKKPRGRVRPVRACRRPRLESK